LLILCTDLAEFVDKVKLNDTLKGLTMSMVAINGSYSLEIMDSYKYFLQHSNRLMHLDLSNDNLGAEEVLVLAEGMRISKCLISVHLSGNFVEPSTREKVRAKLKIKEAMKPCPDQFSRVDSYH